MVFALAGWFTRVGFLEPKDGNEWRLTCRTLDLKYQQTELDFCANPLAKVIKFLRVILPTVHVRGGLLFVGTFSHFFGENNHHMITFL